MHYKNSKNMNQLIGYVNVLSDNTIVIVSNRTPDDIGWVYHKNSNSIWHIDFNTSNVDKKYYYKVELAESEKYGLPLIFKEFKEKYYSELKKGNKIDAVSLPWFIANNDIKLHYDCRKNVIRSSNGEIVDLIIDINTVELCRNNDNTISIFKLAY